MTTGFRARKVLETLVKGKLTIVGLDVTTHFFKPFNFPLTEESNQREIIFKQVSYIDLRQKAKFTVIFAFIDMLLFFSRLQTS